MNAPAPCQSILNLTLRLRPLIVWELQQQGFIREIYFRGDRHTAVLVLECADINHADSILSSLPLVQQKPYPI